MEVDRLKKDEILYELRARGIVRSSGEDFGELRSLLRDVLKRENSGELFDEPEMDPEEELMICDGKLDEVRYDIDVPSVVSPRRVRTLLFHLNSRLVRCFTYCTFTKNDQRERCKKLLKELKAASVIFKATGSSADYKAPSVVSVSTCHEDSHSLVHHSAPSLRSYSTADGQDPVGGAPFMRQFDLSEEMRSMSLGEPDETRGRVSFPASAFACGPGGRAGSQNFSFGAVPRSRQVSRDPEPRKEAMSIPLHKWGITFSGSKEGSVNSFIIRLEELAESRGGDTSELFQGAIEFFTDSALIWYRSVRHQLQNWEELKTSLRRDFLPPDYELALWDELRSRKQGRDEPVQTYVSCMLGLVERLSSPVAEQLKLELVMRNLAPYYVQNMPLESIISITHLKEAARNLDMKKHLVAGYDNRTPRVVLEPDLACKSFIPRRPAIIHEVKAVPAFPQPFVPSFLPPFSVPPLPL
ncbi:Activity-regulated cytoskeleton associated protein 2 [Frankliniella fusca]|uniref:Activity-regulated cytoskeleton associated protein 2 n=1 Tax=Frankliniella fusca TaxID=407009 RepID=A0AAE1GXF2_9NEOP|nr:Activity-regulated cytoskeleton associated protein 2 [Frankliniella fusca]